MGNKEDKYGGKYGEDLNNKGDNKLDNKGKGGKHKVKERMGRCCRCHRIFPRRLLTINRYFYKENRK